MRKHLQHIGVLPALVDLAQRVLLAGGASVQPQHSSIKDEALRANSGSGENWLLDGGAVASVERQQDGFWLGDVLQSGAGRNVTSRRLIVTALFAVGNV